MPGWTVDDMPDQTGKVAIVTGANRGIGFEAARALASKDAQVVMACRSQERGAAAAQQIYAEYPDAMVDLMELDLADLASVRQFAKRFTSRYDRLDILINNAGVRMAPELRRTADGFEAQFGTNHLGHFALTGLLLDLLIHTSDARVVTVSSVAHRQGRMDFDNLNGERSYDQQVAYGTSKLANLLFTYELHRRFEASGVGTIAAASHPGWTNTSFTEHPTLIRVFSSLFAMPPEQGALPTLYAATAPDVRGGDYYGPGGLGQIWGYPRQVESNALSHDPAVAERLWELSEELTGVTYGDEMNA
jgi:NAD(P)-dependent dehydrogenase (short-subunit alcohol dehydrogenase family)